MVLTEGYYLSLHEKPEGAVWNCSEYEIMWQPVTNLEQKDWPTLHMLEYSEMWCYVIGQVVKSSRPLDPWRWKQNIPVKHLKPFTLWCSITSQKAWLHNYTTVKNLKQQFVSLWHNVFAEHIGVLYHSTVQWLCFGSHPENVWFTRRSVGLTWRNNLIVFLKVKSEDQMFQRQKLGSWLAFLVFSMGHSENLKLYFRHIYKWYVAIQAFQTKAHLFAKQIK